MRLQWPGSRILSGRHHPQHPHANLEIQRHEPSKKARTVLTNCTHVSGRESRARIAGAMECASRHLRSRGAGCTQNVEPIDQSRSTQIWHSGAWEPAPARSSHLRYGPKPATASTRTAHSKPSDACTAPATADCPWEVASVLGHLKKHLDARKRSNSLVARKRCFNYQNTTKRPPCHPNTFL